MVVDEVAIAFRLGAVSFDHISVVCSLYIVLWLSPELYEDSSYIVVSQRPPMGSTTYMVTKKGGGCSFNIHL